MTDKTTPAITREIILRRPVYTQPGRRPSPAGTTITVAAAEAAMLVSRGFAVYPGTPAAAHIATISPNGPGEPPPEQVAASMPPAPAPVKEKPTA
ncbi:hypothetical protein [Komagataeibacter oboediens]|uniref:Uncharacterized protein n=1 Tax=Komagataeibacter oboediens TaxID=65958 RepID=A0ABS5SR33_9PROT|nr:hypothetical protein [Komagataeibacter oboediens]MBL7233378.1 hypothetical protein [Komagataeibacter oboediens]MBT0676680.1 hypothetical protein [Komagataeibacter oboediens]MBT0678205.1 hypothetical protein [Komagataeibacter oboediens]